MQSEPAVAVDAPASIRPTARNSTGIFQHRGHGESTSRLRRPLPTADFSFAVGSEIDGCYHRRAWVKAGLTGLWQVSGRSETGFVEMVMLDLYYAEHGSIFLDLYILLNTIPTVLLARGAY